MSFLLLSLHFVYWQSCLNQVLCLRWEFVSVRETPSFQDNEKRCCSPFICFCLEEVQDLRSHTLGVVEDPKETICSNLFVLPVKNTEIIFLFFSPSLLSAVNSLCPVTRSVKTKHKWIITMSSYWTLYHRGLVNAVTSVFRNITLRMLLWLWNSCAQISLKYPNNTHSQGKHAEEMNPQLHSRTWVPL